MPQIANITVKNAALVDKTFTVLTPAGGDGGVARFAIREGTAPAAFPVASVVARATTNGSRKTTVKVNVPQSYVDPVSGLVKKGPAFEMNVDASMPDSYPESMRDDAVAYGVNFLASTLMRDTLRNGYGLV